MLLKWQEERQNKNAHSTNEMLAQNEIFIVLKIHWMKAKVCTSTQLISTCNWLSIRFFLFVSLFFKHLFFLSLSFLFDFEANIVDCRRNQKIHCDKSNSWHQYRILWMKPKSLLIWKESERLKKKNDIDIWFHRFFFCFFGVFSSIMATIVIDRTNFFCRFGMFLAIEMQNEKTSSSLS